MSEYLSNRPPTVGEVRHLVDSAFMALESEPNGDTYQSKHRPSDTPRQIADFGTHEGVDFELSDGTFLTVDKTSEQATRPSVTLIHTEPAVVEGNVLLEQRVLHVELSDLKDVKDVATIPEDSVGTWRDSISLEAPGLSSTSESSKLDQALEDMPVQAEDVEHFQRLFSQLG